MKLLHQITGILVIVIFLLTGQYMDFYYPNMEGVGDGTRMMLRSRHIYILLAGLVNLGVGVYFVRHEQQRWRSILQLTGSALLLIAPLLLTAAFFYEPTLPHMQRPLTLPAIVALLTGALFHLFSGARQNKESVS